MYRRLGAYELAAGALIALALTLRVWLVTIGLPRFDSDEGTMGLMALHIELHGAHPVFFYGQAYMGSLEAYVAAVLFGSFGASDLTLRLGLIILAVPFLLCMYLLARLLYSHRVALVTLGVLAVGSGELLARQLKAVGGYPELLLFGAATFLCAAYLGMSRPALSHRRVYGFGICGVLAGLGVWSDPLMLPIALAALLLLVATCRRELAGARGLVLVLGILVGLAPAIAYNAGARARGSNTWASVTQIVRAGGTGHAGTHARDSLSQRVAGTVAVSVPVMTGGSGVCRLAPQHAWPLSSHAGEHTVTCTVVHAVWGAGYISLLVLATVLAAIAARRTRRRLMSSTSDPAGQWVCGRALARLAMVLAAGATLLVFALSSAPGHAPWYNVRYLTGLWIALPAIVAVLVPDGGNLFSRTARYAVLAVIAVALILDSAAIYSDRAYASWLHGQQIALASTLESHRVSHIYTDYWTCDWLAFESRERIVCAVLDANLQPSLDRYLPYRAAVGADRRAPYVFRHGTPEGDAFARLVKSHPGLFKTSRSAVFEIYWPVQSASRTY
jgi:hypothetical protein